MFKRVPQAGLVGEAALREAVDYRQVIEAVRRAIEAARTAAGVTPTWCSIVALFDDRAICECGNGKFAQYPYTVAEDYTVTLGEMTPVVMDWKAVAMKEAATEGAILEAKGGPKHGGRYEIVVIRAGLSGNGNYYSDAALREALPLFEQARVFVKSDAEHIAGGGKDVRNLIGQLTGARYVEGKTADTGYIAATFELINPEDAIGVKLREAYARGMQHLFGFSIDAVGKTATLRVGGKNVRAATQFTKVNSVDLIVEPGAGGGLVRMVEADSSAATDEPAATSQEHNDMTLKQRMLEAIKAKNPAKAATINLETVTDDELEAAYREAVAIAPAAAPAAAPAPAAGMTVEQVQAAIAQANARGYARMRIVESKLPAAAQERLQKHFDGLQSFTEADADAAIKAEREYLAKFVESGRVSVPHIEVEDLQPKIADMLDAFFDPQHKNHRDVRSFKECYIRMTGDSKVTGRIDNCDRSLLREALTTTFDQALGDSITRRMIAVYNFADEFRMWRKIARVVPVADFRTNRRVRIGGYADLSTVAENAAYAALTSPQDEEATYAVQKRGGTDFITLEMIRNDDVGAIRRVPEGMGRAAARTMAKFVFDFPRLNANVYDGVALYAAGHNNLLVAALDATQLSAHRQLMLKQTEQGSNDRLGIAPKFLVVPLDLQETAVNLFNRNTNNDKTFQQTWNMEVIPVWYWTDTNDWCTFADPMDIPTIEIGFLDGQEEPSVFVQDLPNVGSLFSNDAITYKIRHIYGGAVLDFRGTTKAVVP